MVERKQMYRVAAALLITCTTVAATAVVTLTNSHSTRAASASLDLSNYRITFDENFNDLSVSSRGPGTKWIAHTPWNGDFGDAQFADPEPKFPFTIEDGILRIEARKDADGKWQSGLLASEDPNNDGFSQQYGYFEIRAKLPPGPGTWPGFWLIGNHLPDASAEVDILEQLGKFPDWYQATVHVWPKNGGGRTFEDKHTVHVEPGTMSADFHTYGAMIDPDWVVFYFDRVEVARSPTPPEARQPFFILLDLALGSAWPIDQTPNPSYMYVDYVRVYSMKSGN
jgi:beta-glucanase (GH16 family)